VSIHSGASRRYARVCRFANLVFRLRYLSGTAGLRGDPYLTTANGMARETWAFSQPDRRNINLVFTRGNLASIDPAKVAYGATVGRAPFSVSPLLYSGLGRYLPPGPPAWAARHGARLTSAAAVLIEVEPPPPTSGRACGSAAMEFAFDIHPTAHGIESSSLSEFGASYSEVTFERNPARKARARTF